METSLQKKDRVLKRSRALIQTATRGDAPEEIIAKGQALEELKRLRPWRYEGQRGGFKAWARHHLPYRVARANQYIRIAQGLRLEEVAGTRLCFEVLLVLAEVPVERRAALLAVALDGASAVALRGLLKAPQGEPAPEVRVLRLFGLLHAELDRLGGLGVALSPAAREQIAAAGAETQRRARGLGGEALAQEAALAAEDPRGSTQAAEPPALLPPGPPAPEPPVRVAPSTAGATLQIPPEVLRLRPLFRWFHELPLDRQGSVQGALAAVVRGGEPRGCMRIASHALRPYLAPTDPMKQELRRLVAGMREPGLAGRRFALYCLLGARLPDVEGWLLLLLEEGELPPGLEELCAYFHGRLTAALLC